MDKDLIKLQANAVLQIHGKVAAAKYLTDILFDGIKDKAGQPYTGHLSRVQAGVAPDSLKNHFLFSLPAHRESLQVIALLHDVVEDIPGWTFHDLRDVGFNDYEIDGIRAVTKQSEDEPYFDAMVRVGRVPQAIPVKRSDLKDNSNVFRFVRLPTAHDFERLTKYFMADKYLESIEAGKTDPGTPFGAWMAAQPKNMQDWRLFAKYSGESAPGHGGGLIVPKPSR